MTSAEVTFEARSRRTGRPIPWAARLGPFDLQVMEVEGLPWEAYHRDRDLPAGLWVDLEDLEAAADDGRLAQRAAQEAFWDESRRAGTWEDPDLRRSATAFVRAREVALAAEIQEEIQASTPGD